MSISLEAAVGIVAAILATIPTCISGYRCWQRRLRCGRGTSSAQDHLLPMWRPRNGHSQGVLDRPLATPSHGHHGRSDIYDAAMPLGRHTILLETSRIVLSHQR
ncbi:hypothetical protein BDW71DRAFT_192462 [Aspergillus fruticulosus]